MNSTGSIIQALNGLGYKTVKTEYYDRIEIWKQWYKGNVSKFHDYRIWNGIDYVPLTKASAGMGKKTAEDWADLLMSEKVSITLEGKQEQEFWDRVCENNNFLVMANRYEELAFALGTAAIVVRVSGLTIDGTGKVEEAAKHLKFDYVTAEHVFPLTWASGTVTECAFAVDLTSGGKPYTYLQIHKLTPEGYDIENKLYLTEKAFEPVELDSIKELENVPEVFHTRQQRPLFVLTTPNIANNIYTDCPLGLSVYANAIDQLKAVDNAFDAFNSEVVLGRKRIAIKPEMLKGVKGEQVFDTNDAVFYFLPEDSTPGTMLQDLSTSIRINEIYQALQLALNALSLKCGLGSNHWKFDAGNITTATQVISANSDLFRTLKKHELVLEKVLLDLVKATLRLGNEFMNAGLDEDVEISVDFDDSIIEDAGTEFARDQAMLAAGIINRYEFRMKWLNEDEATAQQALPTLEALTEESE